jgi:hypothetical protein
MGSIADGVTFSGAFWEVLAQTGIRVVRSPEDLGRTYDYIIVGCRLRRVRPGTRIGAGWSQRSHYRSWRTGDTPRNFRSTRLAAAPGQLGRLALCDSFTTASRRPHHSLPARKDRGRI